MAWNVLPAWLPSFGTLNGRPSTESGFTTMVELERLNDEIQMLAGLHNDLADLIKKRKITLFQRILIGRTEEYNYKNPIRSKEKFFEILNLNLAPFNNVTYFLPRGKDGKPNSSHIPKNSKTYSYQLEDVYDKLELLFSEIYDPHYNLSSIIKNNIALPHHVWHCSVHRPARCLSYFNKRPSPPRIPASGWAIL